MHGGNSAYQDRDEIVKEGKELPDIVVIRADTTCRFGAVNYIITECQEQGYRKFALKTMHKPTEELQRLYHDRSHHVQTLFERRSGTQRDRHARHGVPVAGVLRPHLPAAPGRGPDLPEAASRSARRRHDGHPGGRRRRNQGPQGRQDDQVADGQPGRP